MVSVVRDFRQNLAKWFLFRLFCEAAIKVMARGRVTSRLTSEDLLPGSPMWLLEGFDPLRCGLLLSVMQMVSLCHTIQEIKSERQQTKDR
jgi:hypothetical protein